MGSWRTSKRWTSRIASPAMAIVSMLVAGSLLELVLGALHAASLYNDGLLLTAIGYLMPKAPESLVALGAPAMVPSVG